MTGERRGAEGDDQTRPSLLEPSEGGELGCGGGGGEKRATDLCLTGNPSDLWCRTPPLTR